MAINAVTVYFVHLDNRPSDKVIDVLGEVLEELSWEDNNTAFIFAFVDMHGKLRRITLTPENPMCALMDFGDQEFEVSQEPEYIQNLMNYAREVRDVQT
jgi:hypothetical protein